MHYDKMLVEKNEEMNTEADTTKLHYDRLLRNKGRKNKDNTVHYEKQLEAERKGAEPSVIDKKFDEEPKLHNDKRTDKAC